MKSQEKIGKPYPFHIDCEKDLDLKSPFPHQLHIFNFQVLNVQL